MTDKLTETLRGLPGAAEIVRRGDQLWMEAPEMDVVAMAKAMLGIEARLSTMTGIACEDGETELLYHYALPTGLVTIKTITRDGAISSITPVTHAANWIEREIHDLFGVSFNGHPNLERLLRPMDVPQGFFREQADEPGAEAQKRS